MINYNIYEEDSQIRPPGSHQTAAGGSPWGWGGGEEGLGTRRGVALGGWLVALTPTNKAKQRHLVYLQPGLHPRVTLCDPHPVAMYDPHHLELHCTTHTPWHCTTHTTWRVALSHIPSGAHQVSVREEQTSFKKEHRPGKGAATRGQRHHLDVPRSVGHLMSTSSDKDS